MKRAARFGAAAIGMLLASSGALRAQLVPLSRCHAAFPCSVPYGLRPADAAANLPDAGYGNTLIGVGVDNALKPRIIGSPLSSDPVEDAARLYVKKNPLKARTPTPRPDAKPLPTPAVKP